MSCMVIFLSTWCWGGCICNCGQIHWRICPNHSRDVWVCQGASALHHLYGSSPVVHLPFCVFVQITKADSKEPSTVRYGKMTPDSDLAWCKKIAIQYDMSWCHRNLRYIIRCFKIDRLQQCSIRWHITILHACLDFFLFFFSPFRLQWQLLDGDLSKDEIDAIGGKRFSQGTSADREIQRTLKLGHGFCFRVDGGMYSWTWGDKSCRCLGREKEPLLYGLMHD